MQPGPRSKENVKEDNEEKRKLNMEALQIKARKGDAHSQYALGCAYQYGEVVTEDLAEAVKWLLSAAEKGDAEVRDGWAQCAPMVAGCHQMTRKQSSGIASPQTVEMIGPEKN